MRPAPLFVLALTGTALAGPPDEVVVDLRGVDGVDDVSAMRLGLLGVGVRARVAPTLDVQALALALVTAGEAERGAPAPGGGGGELGFRIMPWPDARVRPHAGASLGVLLFPRTPFLPGGDVYEGIITFAAGAEATLAPHWTLGLRGFLVHLSNGQGLGAHNPAYDGLGGALEVSYAPRRRRPAPASAPRPSPDPALAVAIDAELGAAGDDRLAAVRARPVVRLAPGLDAVGDLEAGRFADEPFVELGAAVTGGLDRVTGAVHGGYRRFAGIDVAIAAIQAELRATPELTVVAMGQHERARGLEPRWRAGVGLRVAPVPELTIDLGLGFDRIGDHTVFGDDHMDPYLGASWTLPWRPAGQQLALVLERQISTVDVIGVRASLPAPIWQRVR